MHNYLPIPHRRFNYFFQNHCVYPSKFNMSTIVIQNSHIPPKGTPVANNSSPLLPTPKCHWWSSCAPSKQISISQITHKYSGTIAAHPPTVIHEVAVPQQTRAGASCWSAHINQGLAPCLRTPLLLLLHGCSSCSACSFPCFLHRNIKRVRTLEPRQSLCKILIMTIMEQRPSAIPPQPYKHVESIYSNYTNVC